MSLPRRARPACAGPHLTPVAPADLSDAIQDYLKEIYKLGLKHGMKLATISGVNGVYTPEDVAEMIESSAAQELVS